MYDVTQSFLEKVTQNDRVIRGKLYIGNIELTNEDIISMDMEYSLGNDSIPAIGGAVASKINVKLLKDNIPPVFTTQELKPYIGIEISEGNFEFIPMGVFRINPTDTVKTERTVSLVGYDVLYSLENMPYETSLTFPTTWNNIKTELETQGIKFANQELDNIVIKEKPNTVRELLSIVAELLGRNVVTNRLGEIEFRKLTVTNFETDNYENFKLLADDEVKLTRLTIEKEEEELTYGNDTGFTIKIKNSSIATTEELKTVYDRVFPISYIAYECSLQGLPHLDVGDIIKLIDRFGVERNIPIVYHKISYTGGLKSELRANAPQDKISSTGSTGSKTITQSLNDLRLNILEVNQILADKADINLVRANEARINDLYATKANIIDLQATNAEIDNLKVNKADVDELNAAKANITALESDIASINHLLAGNLTAENIKTGAITAGSGIIADGAIGDAQISSLNANKINAGTIDTSKVTIAGPNGQMKFQGNKLQIFDLQADGQLLERIMLGVDENNDASLVLRGADGKTVLLTQDGLTDEGFTDGYNKLEDGSLDPVKINISKVVESINEGTTKIDGSKIEIDNTALNVLFNTLQQTVNNHGQKLDTHTSQISAMSNEIALKVSNQTYETDKQNFENRLTTAESSIQTLSGEISLKVNKTEVYTKEEIDNNLQEAVDNIQVGGRNLILNSNTLIEFPNMEIIPTDGTVGEIEIYGDEWGRNLLRNSRSLFLTGTDYRDITIREVVNNEYGRIEVVKEGYWNSWAWGHDRLTDNKIFSDSNSEYTLSLDVRTTRENIATLQFNIRQLPGHANRYSSNSIIIPNTNGKWKRVSTTMTIPNDQLERNALLILFAGLEPVVGDIIEYRNIKIEKGSQATPWTPAPEDFNNTKGVLYNLSADIESNTWYTLSVKTDIVDDFIGVWLGNSFVGFLDDNNTITFSTGANNQDRTIILKSLKEEGTIEWVKLEKGNKATDWTPAPEDVEEDIQNAEDNAKSYTDDIATRIEEKTAQLTASVDGITSEVSSIITEIGQVREYAESLVQQSADQLQVSITEQLDDLEDELVTRFQSEIQATADELTLKFTEYQESLSEIGADINNLKTTFRFSSHGLEIGQSDSPLKMLLSNEKLSFLDSGSEIAYVSSQKLFITEAEVLNSIKLGNHVIEKYNDEITLIRWVG
jgi:hypothetical protein